MDNRQPRHGHGGAGALAGAIGGAVCLISQLFLLWALDFGPPLTQLFPQLFAPPTGADLIIVGLFVLAEGAVLGFLLSLLWERIPGRGWVKGLPYGVVVWIVVNLLPLLGATALFQGPPPPELAGWSFFWLLMILLQTVISALAYQGLLRLGTEGRRWTLR